MGEMISHEVFEQEKARLEAKIARLEELNRKLVQAHEETLTLASKYRIELEKLRKKNARPEIFYYGGKVSNG